MSEAANLDIVRRGYEAFGRGDVQTLLGLFDERIEWVTPGPPQLATSGRRRGHQEVAGFFQLLGELYEFDRFEPKQFIAQGNTVIVLGEESVRVKSTGARLDMEWAHAFELRDGKVVGFREYFDTAAVVTAMQAAQTATR